MRFSSIDLSFLHILPIRVYKPRDHSTPRGGKNQAKQEEILRFAVSISVISLSTLHRTSQNKDEGQAFMT